MKAYVIHENHDWMPPFRRELARAGIPYEEWFIDKCHLDFDDLPPPGVFINRVSPSAHTRGHEGSVEFTRSLLHWLQSHGRRVINGPRAFELEVSKTRQYAALRDSGIDIPRTLTVVGGAEQLKKAARRIPAPFILKHNRGGSGASVRRFADPLEFDRYVDSEAYEPPADHLTLLQEYIEAPTPLITRVEIVGGRFLYAMHVDTSAGRHDWYYRLARRLRLPRSWRRAADQWYRDRVVEQVDAHVHLLTLPVDAVRGLLARAKRIAAFRYRGLRLLGWRWYQVWQLAQKFWYDFSNVGSPGSYDGGQLVNRGLLDVGTQGLNPRPEGRAARLLVAPSPEDLSAHGLGPGRQLPGRASLADARLPGQHHQLPLAGNSLFQGRPQVFHHLLAADETV